GGTHRFEGQRARPRIKNGKGAESLRAFAEQFETHLAPYPMRAGDGGEGDGAIRVGQGLAFGLFVGFGSDGAALGDFLGDRGRVGSGRFGGNFVGHRFGNGFGGFFALHRTGCIRFSSFGSCSFFNNFGFRRRSGGGSSSGFGG